MGKGKLDQFFKMMAEDQTVQEKVKSFNGDIEALAAYAVELGYDVSAEELRRYTDSAVKMLNAKLQEKAARPEAAKSPGTQAFLTLTKLADTDENVAKRLEELAEGTPEELIAYGAQMGFVFTKQDLVDIGKDVLEPTDELSEEELELVAGGLTVTLGLAVVVGLFMAGGVAAGLVAGGVVGGGAVVGFVLGFTALAK